MPSPRTGRTAPRRPWPAALALLAACAAPPALAPERPSAQAARTTANGAAPLAAEGPRRPTAPGPQRTWTRTAFDPPPRHATTIPRTPPRVTAAALLARLRACRPLSHGKYRADAGGPARIPVCGTGDTVHWKADLDIDCDGQPGQHCNPRTDPYFQDTTAYTRRDGRALSAERLPYVVVPGPSARWRPAASGIGGGTLAALVHAGRVRYAVVGDTGPTDLLGEASWAAAKALGIDPDPSTGGTSDEVAYLLFPDTRVSPVEDRHAAVEAGERRARAFLADQDAAPGPGHGTRAPRRPHTLR